MTDAAIVRELGRRLRRARLNRDISQEDLASQARMSVSTLKKLESGGGIRLVGLISVLRALAALDELDALVPAPGPSPLSLAKLHGRVRRRASRSRGSSPEDPRDDDPQDDAPEPH